MADDVTITAGANSTPPAGTVIATDDVGSKHYQRVKIDVGGDGASSPVTDIATSANQQAAVTAATIYNVTMTSADTEYSQALPANTKRFSLQCLTNFDVRFAFVTGKVAAPTAPYALVRAGMNYYEENLNLAAVTVYVACADAAKVAEIVAWT